MKTIEMVDEAVTNVNDGIYDDAPKELVDFINNNGNLLTYHSDGFSIGIECLGFNVWSSEDDMRKYNEETDEYEPLTNFLEREVKNMLSILSKFIKNKEYNEDE